MTYEMSNKQFCRVRSNAQAEAGLEHRKLREEIEALKHDNAKLFGSLNSAESEIERLRARAAFIYANPSILEIEARALEKIAEEIGGDGWITSQSLRYEANRIRKQAIETPERQS